MSSPVAYWTPTNLAPGRWERVMGRVKIDILGITELKWTRMGKFNSDDHYIYYFRQ